MGYLFTYRQEKITNWAHFWTEKLIQNQTINKTYLLLIFVENTVIVYFIHKSNTQKQE